MRLVHLGPRWFLREENANFIASRYDLIYSGGVQAAGGGAVYQPQGVRMRLKSVFRVLSITAIILFVGGLSEAVVQAEPAAILTAPGRLLRGGEAAATLTAVNAQTRKPLLTTYVLELLDGAGTATRLSSGFSGFGGHQRIRFAVPPVNPGSYTLRVTLNDGTNVSVPVSVTSAPALLIETDKPIYRPSQSIQGRVVRLSNDLLPQSGPLEIVILDGKGIRVSRQQLEADEYGVADFSLPLASELNEGIWRIRASSEGVESIRDLRVERYVLPRFDLNLDFERDWALVSDAVRGRVSAGYFFGQDVAGDVSLVASRWVGVWVEYARFEGTLDGGVWEFELPPVGFVTGTPQNGGQGAIRVEVEVTDSTGHSQATEDSLLISNSEVVFSIQPQAKTLKPGLPFPVRIESTTPAGEPVDSQVTLEASFHNYSTGQVSFVELSTTTVNGALLWALEPPSQIAYADLTAKRGKARTDVRLVAGYSPGDHFLALNRTDGSGAAAIGQQVRFQVLSTQPSTTYFEVFGGGRTVFSAFTEGASFAFPVTIDMAPAAKVIAYQLTPNNEVIADNLTFDVEIPLEATLGAGFDAETVKPGDEVEITLDTGLKRRSLLGVSVVDQSVLALGRSRLHLESVFEELERRFLEPVAQVIEDGFDPGIGIGLPFAGPISSPGAEQVFGLTGLVVASTPNLSVPEGRVVAFGPPINLSPPPEADFQGQAPESPRLRQYFPETWVWQPKLLTDEEGRATLKLQAPDSITGWKLAAVATHPDPAPGMPGISFGEAELTVFQDFFLEPSLPYSVVRGERFPLKVDLFNYLPEAQTVRVDLETVSGLEFLEPSSREITIDANSAVSAQFAVRPTRVGTLPLRITGLGAGEGDAVLRELRVVPEGLPVEEVSNSILEAGQIVDFTPKLPVEAVPDSTRAFLALTPSLVGQSMQGVDDLLEMPYGCGEQNMIFLAPDIEILKYLREIGELSPEIRITAEHFINTGYQRQLTFQTEDGGFSAFGDPPGSLWLTAFVLSSFSGAREVRDIDETVLSRAAAMLLTRQNEDGSFEPDRFLIHSEMDGGLENLFAMSAYVTNALADYGGAEVAAGLQRAAGFLSTTWTFTGIRDHSYSLAIAAVALQKISGFESTAEAILDRLVELAIDDENGLHWEPFPVETTGYVLMALLASRQGEGRRQAQPALDWLSTQRNSLGGYGGSTQDTVVALKALFQAARKVHRDLDVRIELTAGEEVLLETVINESNFDLLHQAEIPLDGRQVLLKSEGRGNVGYQVTLRYHVPGRDLPRSPDLEFEVFYETAHVEVDDIVDVLVRMTYKGRKLRTAMIIADVAIPTGFESVRSSLDRLVKLKLVERYEIAGRKHIFYIEGLDAFEELSFDFQIKALYPVRSEAGISQVYEYYDAAVRAFHRSDPLLVVDPDQAPPEVDSISPQASPGGSTLLIRGSGFLSGAIEVLFNGNAASVRVLDDTTMLVTVPNLEPGGVELSVVGAGGEVVLEPGSKTFQIEPGRVRYPLFAAPGGAFNGFALANLSGRSARLTATARGAGGELLQLASNPAQLEVDPGRQAARLDSQLLGRQMDKPAWVEWVGDNAEVVSLFQFGDGRALDGLPPFSEASAKFWLTRIFQGPTAFRGHAASTQVVLANPNGQPARVRLRLFSGQGSDPVAEVIRSLAAFDLLSETADALFSRQSIAPPAHVEVDVIEGPGVVGFSRIDALDKDTVVGLTGMTVPDSQEFWSAQFATSPGALFSNLKLLNTSSGSRQAQLVLIADSGSQEIGRTAVGLEAGEMMEADLEDLFDLPQGGATISGSLRIEADGPGLLGDVLFGAPDLENAALLALQSEPVRKVAFGHIGDTPDFFTGLALHVTEGEAADVTVKAYSPQGRLLGSSHLSLSGFARFSRELVELIPATRGVNGGYVVIESTRPLVAQELFGDRGLRYLSAVPATALE